jgi:hypothetical protein
MAGLEAERLRRARREFERLADTRSNPETLFRRAAEVLRRVVPFDGGC